jgi:hypothetical protein
MKKSFALTVLACAAAIASAKPSYKDARDMYDHMSKTRYATGVWHKKSMQESLAAKKEAQEFTVKAEKLFGASQVSETRTCLEAAYARQAYVSQLHDNWLIVNGRIKLSENGQTDIFPAMFNAFAFGEKMANCYEAVESLDLANKPKK